MGIIYRSPSRNNFPEILNKNFPSIDTGAKEIYIFGDFKINMYKNNEYIVHENYRVSTKFVSGDTKNYNHFCTMRGLKQLIQCPTRVTCSTSALIDHVLASFPLKVSLKGLINLGLSDHQLIFCTQKISKFKQGGVYKYINFRSLKNYRVDDYKKSLGQLVFSDYEIFDDVNETYSDFLQKIMAVLTKLHLSRPNEGKEIPRSGLMVQYWKN